MIRFRPIVVGLLLAAVTAAPVAAADRIAVRVETGFTSDNVEWVDVIARHSGSSGGKLVGKHYYVTDPRGVYIYDVSDPESPALLGELSAPQIGTGIALAQEEPDTNGKILLVNAWRQENPSGTAALLVIDVKDKAAPTVVGTLNLSDHTWTCFLDCKYAIGRTGHIIDLRDPAKPEKIADWREHIVQPGYMHDFEEVAPGRLIGSGQPSLYLDVTNPTKPRQLARIESEFHSLGYHGGVWPNNATDRFLLMGAEVAPAGATNAAGSDCTNEGVHALATYDAGSVVKVDRLEFGRSKASNVAIQRQRAKASFRKLEEWRIEGRGAYADGNAPAHTLYCGHWFDDRPGWRNGGTVALAHYDWGTRFLKVDKKGAIEQIGYFQPVLGYTASAKWITKKVVYVHDYRRGLDILRFTG